MFLVRMVCEQVNGSFTCGGACTPYLVLHRDDDCRPLSCTQCQIDDTGDICGCPNHDIWTWIGKGQCMCALYVLVHWRRYLECNACHTAKICKCANDVPPMQSGDDSRPSLWFRSFALSCDACPLQPRSVSMACLHIPPYHPSMNIIVLPVLMPVLSQRPQARQRMRHHRVAQSVALQNLSL